MITPVQGGLVKYNTGHTSELKICVLTFVESNSVSRPKRTSCGEEGYSQKCDRSLVKQGFNLAMILVEPHRTSNEGLRICGVVLLDSAQMSALLCDSSGSRV
jgi:hypothetical protein